MSSLKAVNMHCQDLAVKMKSGCSDLCAFRTAMPPCTDYLQDVKRMLLFSAVKFV